MAAKSKKKTKSHKAPKKKALKSSLTSRAKKTTKAVKPKRGTIRKTTFSSAMISSKKPIGSTKKSISPIKSLILGEISPYEEKFGEEYMNEKQRNHFREILQQRKHQIQLEMERTVHHLQDDAVNFADPNDRATQEEEFSLELRARDRELKFIKNIEDALQKLNDGLYGYCDICGVEIGIGRLEARPTANLCIDCKTLDEIREKQMGG